MRSLSLLFFALLFALRPSFAQEGQPAKDEFQAPLVIEPVQFVEQPLIIPTPGSVTSLQSYIVKLTEFRFKTPPTKELSSQEVLDLYSKADSDQIELVDSVCLSVLAGYESMAHFGKSTSVTTAVSEMPSAFRTQRAPNTPDGGPAARPDLGQRSTVRQTQQRSLGTILRVTINTQENLALLKLQYEASRIVGDIPDNTAPDNQTVRYQSTLLVEPGKPTLLSGSTSKGNTYLILLLEKK